MTLTKLIIGLAVFALILTIIQKAMDRKLIQKEWLSFLQNFVGGLFIFSGIVKAVDPLGTAYKMEQYFAEFETTFEATSASFLAPLFPVLADYAVAFSVLMIVFEILLGITLLLGAWRKFTTWSYFLLVLLFTFLTGFTYLTAYVPEGVNFFQFAQWGPFVDTNMKVTDCGCFGDFLKLEPYVSFMKDLFLLIPGLIFLFTTKSFHQLTQGSQRAIAIGLAIVLSLLAIYLSGYALGWRIIVFALALIGLQFLSKNLALASSVVALLIFSFSNYVTDIPQVDFRPFNLGKDIATQKALEEESEANVKVIAYRITNRANGEVQEIPFDDYMKRYQDFPKEEFELEQLKTEPEIARTKISDFSLSNAQGEEITEALLAEPSYVMMIVAYKLYGDEHNVQKSVQDSLFVVDTVRTENDVQLNRRLVEVRQRDENVTEYSWDPDYVNKWKEGILPTLEAAKAAGVNIFCATSYSDPDRIADFKKTLGVDYPFFLGDDIMLKTILRSNPGIVLMQQGKILGKWHYKKLPSFEKLAAEFNLTEGE